MEKKLLGHLSNLKINQKALIWKQLHEQVYYELLTLKIKQKSGQIECF